nr:MAG TPA: hypothetical protein [Microviridae sp.]
MRDDFHPFKIPSIARLRRSFFSDISTICVRVHTGNSYVLDVTVSGDTPMHVRVPNAQLGCLLFLCFVVYALSYGDKAFGVLVLEP